MGGQLPQIRLIEEDDKVAETLSITKWDTDTIVEFLNTYLEPASAALTSDEDADDKTSKSEEDAKVRANEL